jgi:hypothetical protein
MPRFACSFAGQCEIDDEGDYESDASCRADCETVDPEDRELAYITLQYDLETAMHLAPSDRVAFLRRLTGVTIPTTRTRDVIQTLNIGNELGRLMDEFPQLRDYIHRTYHWSVLSYQLPVTGLIGPRGGPPKITNARARLNGIQQTGQLCSEMTLAVLLSSLFKVGVESHVIEDENEVPEQLLADTVKSVYGKCTQNDIDVLSRYIQGWLPYDRESMCEALLTGLDERGWLIQVPLRK